MANPDLDFDAATHLLHQHSNDPLSASKAITFLSKASHNSSTSRERLADPTILKDLLNLLSASNTGPNPPGETTEQLLRCIGNAVISSDTGRQTVTDHGFGWASSCLRSAPSTGHGGLIRLRALNALNNICFDFAPAQQRCYEEHVHEDCLYGYCDTYSKPGKEGAEEAEMYGDLLLSICEHRQAGDELKDEASRERVLDLVLLLRGKYYDVDALATVVEVVLLYLRDEVEQRKFIEAGVVRKVWEVLVEVEARIANEETQGEREGEENVRLLVPVAVSLTWCLSDMAAVDIFAERYGNRSELIQGAVFDAIKSAARADAPIARPRLVSAACQILGNLLWSVRDKDPSTYDVDVMDLDLHRGAIAIATTFGDAETLHSVAGLLIHLCWHSDEYTSRLCGDEQLSSVLRRLCKHDVKEVRQGGMKLLQLLGKDDAAVREEYSGLAKQVMESLVVEQNPGQHNTLQQNGSVVELPD